MQVCGLNSRHLWSQCSCSIKKDDNAKILLTHVRKMQHIVDNKTAPSIEAIIDKEKLDISARKVWVL